MEGLPQNEERLIAATSSCHPDVSPHGALAEAGGARVVVSSVGHVNGEVLFDASKAARLWRLSLDLIAAAARRS